jgi:hypothetical protein
MRPAAVRPALWVRAVALAVGVAAQVLDDVSNQTISPEAALAMYGVVIENNLVNTPETERVRKGLRENRIMQKEGI